MVTFAEEENKLTCSFSERMNTDSCMEFEGVLYEKIAQVKNKMIIFDMRKVAYVSSLFLGICMKVLKEVGSENFSLINVHPNIKKVFKISKLDAQINIA